jgi:hypothetical protein
LDTFLNVAQKFTVLRIETDKSEQNLKLPSFLHVIKEVTSNAHRALHVLILKLIDDKAYSSEEAAKLAHNLSA